MEGMNSSDAVSLFSILLQEVGLLKCLLHHVISNVYRMLRIAVLLCPLAFGLGDGAKVIILKSSRSIYKCCLPCKCFQW